MLFFTSQVVASERLQVSLKLSYLFLDKMILKKQQIINIFSATAFCNIIKIFCSCSLGNMLVIMSTTGRNKAKQY